MKRVKLGVKETLTYKREIEIEIPDKMTESDLNRLLDSAQGWDKSASDFVWYLRKNGVELPNSYDDSMDSPWSMEVECEEYDFV